MRKYVRFFALRLLTNVRSQIIITITEQLFEIQHHSKIVYMYTFYYFTGRGYKILKRKGLSANLLLLVIGTFILLFSCLFLGNFMSSAHENDTNSVQSTYYKSIRIQPGDTLWDIAEETMTSEYESTKEYVQVLKDMNSLSSDHIEAGQYLIVAYNE